ncbi:hypothetical protein GCM10007079_07010 [Nocardiopsis terrae]|uniref:FtsX-like permease family protein n=1 Tax=Nocardiopsis terrae TaxID=372655 RepID=A0ABR9HP37_9ACTN|nr:hypothetical protein [Nocardiopsis terrae]MBE1460748.1 hypothetical protein [Nocardiopsis terrae]GHC73246.1 hypothetical protein GCM10007079_07010 [Nocardiopsis terrae]
MRPSAILSEAWRNLATGTSRAAVFGLGLAVVCGALAVADARNIVALEQRAAEFVASGASVRVLSAESSVNGSSCDALSGVPGVGGAGALRERAALRLDAMPDNPLPAYTVTPGLAAVLGVETVTAEGVWLSEETARTLEATPGQSLGTAEGALTVAGTFPYPDDGRDVRPGYAALVPSADTDPFDECWARVWPPSESTQELLLSAVAADSPADTALTTGQLNASLGETFDGAAEFSDRITRFVPPATALAGLLLGFVSVRLRRLEFASALHVGQSRRSQLVTALLETGVWSTSGLVLAGCALVLASHAGNPGEPGAVLAVSGPGLVAAVPACLAGAALALAGVRERHLFRYFKER